MKFEVMVGEVWLGLKRLFQLWERSRYFSASEEKEDEAKDTEGEWDREAARTEMQKSL